MAEHLEKGGVLIIEPWFTPDKFYPGTPHAKFIDEPDLKIARVNTSFVEGRVSYFDMHYLIGTPEGTDHFVERQRCGQRVRRQNPHHGVDRCHRRVHRLHLLGPLAGCQLVRVPGETKLTKWSDASE